MANIGTGHAATALSQLFNQRVDMTPPRCVS
ncbi:MAG: chemotaxis protein CheC [Acidimicrobiia bacterium]